MRTAAISVIAASLIAGSAAAPAAYGEYPAESKVDLPAAPKPTPSSTSSKCSESPKYTTTTIYPAAAYTTSTPVSVVTVFAQPAAAAATPVKVVAAPAAAVPAAAAPVAVAPAAAGGDDEGNVTVTSSNRNTNALQSENNASSSSEGSGSDDSGDDNLGALLATLLARRDVTVDSANANQNLLNSTNTATSAVGDEDNSDSGDNNDLLTILLALLVGDDTDLLGKRDVDVTSKNVNDNALTSTNTATSVAPQPEDNEDSTLDTLLPLLLLNGDDAADGGLTDLITGLTDALAALALKKRDVTVDSQNANKNTLDSTNTATSTVTQPEGDEDSTLDTLLPLLLLNGDDAADGGLTDLITGLTDALAALALKKRDVTK